MRMWPKDRYRLVETDKGWIVECQFFMLFWVTYNRTAPATEQFAKILMDAFIDSDRKRKVLSVGEWSGA